MALAYKVTCAEKTVVYATDNDQYRFTLEYVGQRAEAGRQLGQRLGEEFVTFVSQSDLYIGEAQYTDEEYPGKIGWGYSPLSATVEVALKANVKTLALFHHDPLHSDEVVATMESEARRLVARRGAAPSLLRGARGPDARNLKSAADTRGASAAAVNPRLRRADTATPAAARTTRTRRRENSRPRGTIPPGSTMMSLNPPAHRTSSRCLLITVS